MTVTFRDIQDSSKKFDLGTVSMEYLDRRSTFDKFQEDNDPSSDIIFKTGKANVAELGALILDVAHADGRLRADIREKLVAFSEFVKDSEGLIAVID